MKKNNTNFLVSINLKIDDQIKQLDFQPQELRNWIYNLKIAPNQQTVNLDFVMDGKTYSQKLDVKTDFAELKRAIKYAELSRNIIPTNLHRYLVDITKYLSTKKVSKLIGREHEIEKAWFYLAQKTRNNVFLIGGKDVGKTAIANEIARRISVNDCPKEFYDKRVIRLYPELLLKIKNDYLYKFQINQILHFLENNKNNIIIFVDKAINMKTDLYLIYILYACLKKYNIPLIATSSEKNFADFFYKDQSIDKYINYIYVEEPELNEIEAMIRPYTKNLEKQYGITISDKMVKYAIFTSGLSDSISENPGKVINILERAFLNAKCKDKEEIDKQSILNCYNTRIKEYLKTPEEEKRATAYHETGHYILTIKSKYRKNIKISCVSNLPTNWWAGVTMSYYDIEQYSVFSDEYYLELIAMFLAGRIAEKKFTNLNSTGASGDLEHANNIAKAMIMEWGFSQNPSNINRQYDYIDYYLMPESKKEAIDNEVQNLIDKATQLATDVINENEELLKIIAEKLLVEEILTGEELEMICKEYEETKNNK